MGPYSFELLLVSSSLTCGKNTTSKAFNHFGYFPRQSILSIPATKINLEREIFSADLILSGRRTSLESDK
jgi:hypothetical protein